MNNEFFCAIVELLIMKCYGYNHFNRFKLCWLHQSRSGGFLFFVCRLNGEKCTIYLINKTGDVFCAHFDNAIKHDHVEEVCPALKTVTYGMFQSENKDRDWYPFYLGGGNFLQVNSCIHEELTGIVTQGMSEEEKMLFSIYRRCDDLCRKWKDVVLSIIDHGSSSSWCFLGKSEGKYLKIKKVF